MHEIFPKVNQVFSFHLKNFEIIKNLMDSVSLRVDAEQQYERAINKSAQKISDLQSDHPLYSKILFSFKSLINERAHQIRHFKQQISKQAEQLRNALTPIQQFMKNHLTQLKNMQKELKTSFDTLTKNRNVAQQKFKQLDEKFVLNQISVLYKQNIGLRKNSESLINEQEIIMKSLQKDWESLKQGVIGFQSRAQQREKKIWQLDVLVEEQFVDFFKKLNVHQISLIRNIQYDIDTMIKKTDIFNWQNTNQFKDQFSIKTINHLEQALIDPYRGFKKALIAQQNIMDAKQQTDCDLNRLTTLTQKLKDKKDFQEILALIRKDYPSYRDQICIWIQSFRKNGHFKFQSEQFMLVTYQFRQFLKCAINSLDFQCVQKTIMYGNSYFTILPLNNKKKTILDEIKGEKLLSDLNFWRFYLLWTIRQSIVNCKAKEEKQIHLKNGVYTTLLSNSLAMVQWGIEKHSIKNLIGKLAKTYAALTEAQVAQLLKVIETAYQNLQKNKKGKKE